MAQDDARGVGGLPEGWLRTTVGDIYNVVGGGTPSTKVEEYWQGDIAWISSADIYGPKDIRPRRSITEDAIRNSATNLVPAGSLIVVTRVGLGKVALTREPICFSQDSQALIGNEDVTFPDYAIYYLSQAVQEFRHKSRGTTIAGVTKKQLVDLPFLLPPLPEQRRIVAEIETQFTRLEAGVAALKRAQANLRRYKASVLKAACEGRLVPTEAELARAEGRDYEPADVLLQRILAQRRARWEEENPGKKYKEPTSPDTSGMRALPEGWVWATLAQCFEVQRGRFSIRPRNDPRYYNGPYPFVQIGDLPKEGGRVVSFSQTLNEDGLKVSRMFPAGTVLVAIVGATIANTGILAFDSCCPDSLVAIQAQDELRLRYVDLYLRAKKMEIRRSSYASGGQPNINLRTLMPYPFPLPPLAEQQRIVAEVERRLSVVGELEKQVEAALRRAERLRQAILKHAFEGKLVPQDPEDEPASALLAQIKADKAQRPVPHHTSRRRTGRKGPNEKTAEPKDAQQLKLL